MAIAYSSQGAGAGTETSGATLNLVCPATVNTNDILIAHTIWLDVTNAPSTPSGWTLLYGPQNLGDTTVVGRHWVFGKIADGTEDGATIGFGTAGGTNGRYGRIYSFTGWVSGTITQVVPSASFTFTVHETDPQMPTVTTTIAGARAVALVAQDDNNAIASATGESGGDWTEAVAEYTSTTIGVQGCMCQIQTCVPTADPGTVSGGTAATTDDQCGVIGFEIRESALPTAKPGLAKSDDFKASGIAQKSSIYEKDEIAISERTVFSLDEHITSETATLESERKAAGLYVIEYVKSGVVEAEAKAFGEDVIEHIESGTSILDAAGEGASDSAHEVLKSGESPLEMAPSGSDATTSDEVGLAASFFSTAGIRITEYAETGTAVAESFALGSGEQSQANDGKAISEFAVSGIYEVAYSRSGVAVAEFIVEGINALERIRTGFSALDAVGSATDEAAYTDTGIGIIDFVGSGASQSGGDIIKVGTAYTDLVALGSDEAEVLRLGTGIIEAAAAGIAAPEKIRFGEAHVDFSASGNRLHEMLQQGLAISVFAGTAYDETEYVEVGAGELIPSGSGYPEGAAAAKFGVATSIFTARGRSARKEIADAMATTSTSPDTTAVAMTE